MSNDLKKASSEMQKMSNAFLVLAGVSAVTLCIDVGRLAYGDKGLDPNNSLGSRIDEGDKVTVVKAVEPETDPNTSTDYTVYAQDIVFKDDSASIKDYFYGVAVDAGMFKHDKKLEETVVSEKTVHVSQFLSADL